MIAACSKTLKAMTATLVATYRQRLEMHLAKEITPFSPIEHFRLFGGTMGLCEAAALGDLLKVRHCLAVGIDSESPWLRDEDASDCCPPKPSLLQGVFSCCRPERECAPGEGTPLECAHRYGSATGDMAVVELLLSSGAIPEDPLGQDIERHRALALVRDEITAPDWGWTVATGGQQGPCSRPSAGFVIAV